MTTVSFDTKDSQFTPRADNQGWYTRRRGSYNRNTNYIVGRCCGRTDSSPEYRDFFTFDLHDLTSHVVGAKLVLFDRDDKEPFPETLRFFDVTTPARGLNLHNGADGRTFFDLGHGKRFGTFSISGATKPEVRTFELNNRAIHVINQAAGGFFSLGGRLVQMPAGGPHVFGGTDNFGRQRLVLSTS